MKMFIQKVHTVQQLFEAPGSLVPTWRPRSFSRQNGPKNDKSDWLCKSINNSLLIIFIAKFHRNWSKKCMPMYGHENLIKYVEIYLICTTFDWILKYT